jgi:ATPase subunit of ABC transporter with duplicated ATPase domains
LISSEEPTEETASADTKWQLSFYMLNYWVVERKHWTEWNSFNRKQILHNVSGHLQSSTMTAIMGPSGSGKTTLLKLIGGQMFQGEFNGVRAINNTIFSRNKFDEVTTNLLPLPPFPHAHRCRLFSATDHAMPRIRCAT